MSKKEQKTVALTSLKSLIDSMPNFNVPVHIQRADGSKIEVNLTVKALRKSQWAEMRDAHIAKLRQKEGEVKGSDESFSFGQMVGAGAPDAAQLAMGAATGWDWEDDFSMETLVKLEDALPGALTEMLARIDAALFQGRVGN